MGRKPVILVMEDDPGLAWATGCDLRSSGYLAVLVGGGAAAIDFAAQIQVDLFLLDLHMPVMEGWRFLQRRRADPALRRIPVIVQSSSYRRADEVGPDIDAILPRPLPRGQLIERVQATLAAHAAR